MKLSSKKVNAAAAAMAFGAIFFIVLCVVLHTAPDRLIGAAFCHQLPSRSPSSAFPFCFRCAGLFSGICWSILFSLCSKSGEKLFEGKTIAAFAAVFLLFMLDIVNTTEFIPLHWYDEKPEIRFLSSFPLGFTLARIMTGIWYKFFNTFKTMEIFPPFLCLPFSAVTAGVSFLIVFRGDPFILRCFGYLISAGSLLFLLILYSILIRCIAVLKNRYYQNSSVLMAALFIVFLHICLAGGLHVSLIPFEAFENIR